MNSTGRPAMLGHYVYFTLLDNSTAAADALVAACQQRLSDHDGIVFFSAGTRVPDLNRDVNDQRFDVALQIVFRDRAAHDAYQIAPAHLQFIAENKANWKNVRVFDSDIPGPGN